MPSPSRPRARLVVLLATAFACWSTLAACGQSNRVSGLPEPDTSNRFRTEVLAASRASDGGEHIADMVNAWGVAIRPAGAGGHFWVAGGGASHEFIGDVRQSPDPELKALHQDGLRRVEVAGTDGRVDDGSVGKTTGVVFNGAPLNTESFRVVGQRATGPSGEVTFDGSARFIFSSDSGVISAWTDRTVDGEVVRVDGPAATVFDGHDAGMALFGLAIDPSWSTLWAADFGADPQIRQFDAGWHLVPTAGFANPFATGDPAEGSSVRRARPGDPVPWNVQVLGDRVYVAYVISRPDEADPAAFDIGEEDSLDGKDETHTDSHPARGKVVEFRQDGTLVRVLEDDGRLNAPWGMAVAPPSWGRLGGALLVGNFGGLGRIAAFDRERGTFIDYVRGADADPVEIEGLWGLVFGNGASLGDIDALYFTAGPDEERAGIFGALRPAVTGPAR